MGILNIISGMSNEKKMALGLTAAAGVASFYAGITDEKRAKEAAEEAMKQSAYKGGCDIARQYYAKKGNPKAMRKNK